MSPLRSSSQVRSNNSNIRADINTSSNCPGEDDGFIKIQDEAPDVVLAASEADAGVGEEFAMVSPIAPRRDDILLTHLASS